MKRILLSAVATTAVMSFAGAAAAQNFTTGFVGLSYSDIDSANLVSLDGTISLDVAPSVELQLDGNVGTADISGGSNATIWGPTAHLFYDNNTVKGGAYLGYEDLDALGNLVNYGLEGRIAVNSMVSAGASVGWGKLGISGAPDMDLSGYRVEGSVFATDNLRADVAIGNVRYDWGPFTGDSTYYSLGAEWQLDSYPVSFTAGYTHANSDFYGAGSNVYSIGIRRTFGGTLKARDRTSSPFQNGLNNAGGLGANVSGVASVFNDVLNCFDSSQCQADPETEDFFNQFDESFGSSYYCDFFDECSVD